VEKPSRIYEPVPVGSCTHPVQLGLCVVDLHPLLLAHLSTSQVKQVEGHRLDLTQQECLFSRSVLDVGPLAVLQGETDRFNTAL